MADGSRPEETTTAQVAETHLAPALAGIMERHADQPALGERAAERTTDPTTGRTKRQLLPHFDTITYGQLQERVNAVAADWHHAAHSPLHSGDFVCLLGFTSVDYTTLDLACMHLGAVAVPLQSSASAGQLAPIVEEVQPRIIASSVELLDNAVTLATSTALGAQVIVFDHHPEVDDEREKVAAAQERLAAAGAPHATTLAAVLDRGRSATPAPPHIPADGEDPLALLLYTSGSTGTPKGAMYPESLVHRQFVAQPIGDDDSVPTGVNYLPMSHLAGRNSLARVFSRAGTNYFTAHSDQSTLFEDFSLVRPTHAMLIPRVCDMLFQQYQSELDRRADEYADEQALDQAVKQDLRENVLGGRVVEATCGSAPLSQEVADFVADCLQVPLHDGYGSTEAGMVLLDNQIMRPPVLDYKLIDVPELGYFRTDTPNPRGELLVKTDSIIPGYYNRPEVTAEVFDADGYYMTGDVMAELGPDRLTYIDRRKNVLKLSQGEFVAVARLEADFVDSPLIQQIFVYGNSARAYLLAVVVPTEEALTKDRSREALKTAISESLQEIARREDLNSYEIPRDFLVETEPFSNENGLLSDARKQLRPRLVERYGDQLEQLYTELAEGQANELRELRRHGNERPVLETVSRAAQALLGCASTDLDPAAHFTDLGGDSLSALTFSNLLQEIFDVEVPVGFLVSPANDLRRIAERIETAQSSEARQPTFGSVHGAHSTEAHAGDLTLEKFLDATTLENAATLPQADSTPPRTVLLTGANGYLGRFMALDWLERLSERDGTLICIIRGNTPEAARQRLENAFDSGDTQLLNHFRALADKHLHVLAGDIGEPNLGLDTDTWNHLATTVDHIAHPAALVNHVLPYSQLFGPNAVGTAELIRLALTTQIKPITYLSTVAVVGSDTDFSGLDEDADIRVASTTRQLNQSYANGYATSKWAGEVLLRNAHERFGLPVTTFRSDMILAHSHYTGQLNVPDMFTRLLLSLVATGIAPETFYRSENGERPRAHYDGLPAEFTAEAITTLGAQNTNTYQTFNVLNPHDDGISLDTFVDWLNQAGHPIQRITNYNDWASRFETAIRAMPENQRQHSLLPLLHAFQQPAQAIPGSAIPAKRFHAAVQNAEIGPDGDIPHLSAPLIAKYATDLQELGLL